MTEVHKQEVFQVVYTGVATMGPRVAIARSLSTGIEIMFMEDVPLSDIAGVWDLWLHHDRIPYARMRL